MKRTALLALALAVSCGGGDSREEAVDSAGAPSADYFPADSADSALAAPRVVTGPTVILFWLAAGDTLHPDAAAAAQDDLDYYTEKVSPVLAVHGITLHPTNSDTVYVALPNRQRRVILLSGLDQPFGYVLIEPGDVERILTGVYDDESLMDEIRAYFEIEDDTTTVRPKITT